MIELNDSNYVDVLNNLFAEGKTVICLISPNTMCDNCIAMKENIHTFIKENPDNNLEFAYVNYSTDTCLQNYKEMYYFLEYPKSIVFYGNWDNKEFYEGIICKKDLTDINKNNKRI